MPPTAKTEKRIKYAGFWVRFGAQFIDAVILTVIIGALAIFMARSGSLSVLFSLLIFIIAFSYFPFFAIKYGATPGKKVAGLRIIDETLTTPLDVKTALMREIVGKLIVDNITLSLGDFLIIFDSKKQALHDKVGRTFVVYEKESDINIRK